ncbi:MAG: hypothetical protein ACT6QU_09150 [Aliihoeflea sp.]|uniref:hypothetical protein n=1 Tax=Aliihoeflea sp. TaxID=2608088 RepID=UPI004033D6AF
MTPTDATFLSTSHMTPVSDLPSAALRRGLPLALPLLALGPVRKSIAAAGDDGPQNSPNAVDAIGRFGYLAMGCADDVLRSGVLDDAVSATELSSGADPCGSTPRISANDNASDAAILRTRGDEPAVVIGLALRHARFGTGDIPFAIVCALHRHAAAGDGAAKATLDMLKRRIERRQQQRRDRYAAIGLRSHWLLMAQTVTPRLQVIRPDETGEAGR